MILLRCHFGPTFAIRTQPFSDRRNFVVRRDDLLVLRPFGGDEHTGDVATATRKVCDLSCGTVALHPLSFEYAVACRIRKKNLED